MLSDITAEQVKRYRERRGMSRADLAHRCRDLGMPGRSLSEPAIGNIETGRPGKDGKRRRSITVDELMVLAEALGVPPVLLLVPYGYAAEVELLPGRPQPVTEAAAWIEGPEVDAKVAETLGIEQSARVDTVPGLPRAMRAHRRATSLLEAPELVNLYRDDPERAAQVVQETTDALRQLREEMREADLVPPAVSAGLARSLGEA